MYSAYMKTAITAIDYYNQAEQQFIQLLETEELDRKLAAQPSTASDFERAIATAIQSAYQEVNGDDEAHRFLQRILYRINRLKLFGTMIYGTTLTSALST